MLSLLSRRLQQWLSEFDTSKNYRTYLYRSEGQRLSPSLWRILHNSWGIYGRVALHQFVAPCYNQNTSCLIHKQQFFFLDNNQSYGHDPILYHICCQKCAYSILCQRRQQVQQISFCFYINCIFLIFQSQPYFLISSFLHLSNCYFSQILSIVASIL